MYTNQFFPSPFVDLNGNPVKRSKWEYHYSYDPFVVWRGGENDQIQDSVYSDRLIQWDHEKYNDSIFKVFGNHGQLFYDREPELI